MRSNRGAPLVHCAIILGVVGLAIVGPWVAPHPPNPGDLANALLPPAWANEGDRQFLLGTDQFGRDILSRIIHGARISVTLSLICIFFAGTVGTVLGLISGYCGGLVDTLIMRLTDIALSLPVVLIAVLLAAVRGPSYENVIIVVGLFLWPRYCRQIRGEALATREHDFVAAARVAGASPVRIICRHLFPSVVPTLLVLVSLQVGYVIIVAASLSFLGAGIPPPTPDWGVMVADGRAHLQTAWWISMFPGVLILLTVLSMNTIGDWLRDRLDPKLRQA
ncbi:MAG: ABC transporter permease [Chloroflexi bacterium]|nr:ABC transporter permease [Chloroflexota bacterium]